MPDSFIPCTLRHLPESKKLEGAQIAREQNPTNAPRMERLASLLHEEPSAAHIAAMTDKKWPTTGVNLGVKFLDTSDSALKNKILAYANKWGNSGNVKFFETTGTNGVRLSIGDPSGYWSYLGTDILSIPAGQATMNLQQFSMSMPDSEFDRVVCHEFGHTLGYPHEHLRADIVKLLDVQKTIAYFEANQGWSEAEVRAQVLTPISEASLFSPTPVDASSIMCYQLPGSITTNGLPIPGGTGIDKIDADYCAKIYPKSPTPPPPPPPPPTDKYATIMHATIQKIIAANPRYIWRASDFPSILNQVAKRIDDAEAAGLDVHAVFDYVLSTLE